MKQTGERVLMKSVSRFCLVALLTTSMMAQTATTGTSGKKSATRRKTSAQPAVTAEDIQALRQILEQQQQQIQQLQNAMQQRDDQLRQTQSQLQQAQSAASAAQDKANATEAAAATQKESYAKLESDVADVKTNLTTAASTAQDDQKRIGAVEGLLGRFRLSGDVRVRGEGFWQSYAGCTACFDRYRPRIRLRLGIEGKLNEDFGGGMYLATGAVTDGNPSFRDPVSTNETLTSFFERKTVGFDRGWITYNPSAHKWLSLTGGKFAFSWNRTPLTFDNDLNPEGFSEKLSWDFSGPFVKNLNVQAMQFFYNEASTGPDSYATGGSFSGKLALGRRVTITPTYTILNWNKADVIAQAASPVTLPEGDTPAPGDPLPHPTTQPIRVINANAFTNASQIIGTGTGQKRAFVSGFMYSDLILDTNIDTGVSRFPLRLLGEYEQNLRAANDQDRAYWLEASVGQQKNKYDLQLGYSFARIEQDAVISQFNESDMRAPTNVLQHRFFGNWMVAKNTTAAVTLWYGRTLDASLQNAAKAPGLPAGLQDPFLKRLQLDIIYKF
jgi:hypothetical protein